MFSRAWRGTRSSPHRRLAELTHLWPCISRRAGCQALGIRQEAPWSLLALLLALRERMGRRSKQAWGSSGSPFPGRPAAPAPSVPGSRWPVCSRTGTAEGLGRSPGLAKVSFLEAFLKLVVSPR